MKVVGLITEYNPFHNGHKYHIEKAREITGADKVVVVMSGNFVQRGTPAIIDKYTRTRMALNMGADMVFELPVSFACASAEYFAYGAVALLEQLGFVDFLCFGSEAGKLSLLNSIAEVLLDEPESYKNALQTCLKSGHSFPAARAYALKEYFCQTDCHTASAPDSDSLTESLDTLLLSSNNILGIEYLKALRQLNSKMLPFTIKRIGAAYTVHEFDSEKEFSSATAIRNALESGSSLSALKQSVPTEIISLLEKAYQKSFPISENDFSDMLYYKLRTTPTEAFSLYGDVSKDLAFRIKNLLPSYTGYEAFAQELKTKQLTLTRIKRSLLHILLELPDTKKELSFIRLLGFQREASFLLKQLPQNAVPVITKPAHANTLLTGSAKEVFDKEILCSDLYNRIVFSKYGFQIPSDYLHPPVIV